MLKAVIFDLDGTMVDTEHLHSQAFETVLAEYGIRPRKTEHGTVHVAGGTSTGTWEALKEQYNLDVDTPTLVSKKRAAMRAIIDQGLEPMPGLLDLIDDLRAHDLPLAIATSAQRERTLLILDKIGVGHHFAHIVSANDVSAVKPAPDAYLAAAKALGVAPQDCLAFEDTAVGVAAAKAAGMKVVAVPNASTRAMDFGAADLVAASLAEISLEKAGALFKSSYKDVAIQLAREAGDIMLANFKLGMHKDWKDDGTPLTVSDTAINDLVIETITQHFPDHGVLGEERSRPVEGAAYVWVVDPIDGTVPFSHGVPIFAFSLALTHKGESILGVVYDPVLDRLIFAEKGKGAELNGKPTHVSSQAEVAHTLIEVQSWKGYEHNLNPLKDQLIQLGAQATTIGSVVYAGLLVASGEYGGVLFAGPKPWDAAAVKIVVEEAGGRVTDVRGQDQRYDQTTNGIIVSNGKLHDELVALVKPHLSPASK